MREERVSPTKVLDFLRKHMAADLISTVAEIDDLKSTLALKGDAFLEAAYAHDNKKYDREQPEIIREFLETGMRDCFERMLAHSENMLKSHTSDLNQAAAAIAKEVGGGAN